MKTLQLPILASRETIDQSEILDTILNQKLIVVEKTYQIGQFMTKKCVFVFNQDKTINYVLVCQVHHDETTYYKLIPCKGPKLSCLSS